jgi:hypothetical protein
MTFYCLKSVIFILFPLFSKLNGTPVETQNECASLLLSDFSSI